MAVSQSLTLTQVSQDIAANTSQVRILWTSTQSGQSFNVNTRTAHYYVSINGGDEVDYSVTYKLPQSTTQTIIDVTITVPHTATGQGTIDVRTWMDTKISAGVVTKFATLALDTIPRAATLSYASSWEGNGTPTISYENKAGEAVDSLSIGFSIDGGVTMNYPYREIDKTGTTFNLPLSTTMRGRIRNAVPSDGTTLPVVFFLKTVISGVSFTSTKTATYTLTEDLGKPTISVTGTMVDPYDGKLVQGYSKLQVSATITPQFNATIASTKIVVDGKTYTSASFTSNPITNINGANIKVTVVDSRGFTSTYTSSTYEVLPYSPPYLAPLDGKKEIICGRSLPDGTLSPQGTNFRIALRVVQSIADTSKRVSYRRRTESGTFGSWVNIGPVEVGSPIYDRVVSGATLALNTAHIVELKVSDGITESNPITIFIPSDAVPIHEGRGGRNLGLGRLCNYSHQDAIDVGWQTFFNLPIVFTNKNMAFEVESATTALVNFPDDFATPGAYIHVDASGRHYYLLWNSRGKLWVGHMASTDTSITWFEK